MKIRWGRLAFVLGVATLTAGILKTQLGLNFWERLLVMQVPLMVLLWLTKPVTWENDDESSTSAGA